MYELFPSFNVEVESLSIWVGYFNREATKGHEPTHIQQVYQSSEVKTVKIQPDSSFLFTCFP